VRYQILGTAAAAASDAGGLNGIECGTLLLLLLLLFCCCAGPLRSLVIPDVFGSGAGFRLQTPVCCDLTRTMQMLCRGRACMLAVHAVRTSRSIHEHYRALPRAGARLQAARREI
jgi:hypothetical protein